MAPDELARLAQDHRRALVRHAARVAGETRAEDVVQQALVNAHRSGTTPDRPLAWLHAIVHNAALNALREPRWEPLAGHEPPSPGVEEVVEERARLREVLAAISDLPPHQRRALVLREFHGLSHAEVGEALGVSRGAARALIHRARAVAKGV